ncbi:MAG: beta strand repeat-containing protein, partial [Bacteroidia bacterium]
MAGPPPYSNLVVGTQADNAFPLNSTTNNVQWIYGPGAFFAGGVSTGNPANPGKITKVYFQIGATASSSVSYSNFTIKLGQPAALASATVFPSAGWIAGLTTVFQQTSFTITGASSGAFIEIPLQTPFIYDPTKSLVFEMYVTGGTGNQVRQYGGTGNQRMWGTAVNNGTPSAGTGLVRFGIEVMPNGGNDIGISAIDSPTTFCGGPQSIVARVQNYGNNQVSGFNVNWSLNGTPQTPIISTAVLDTFNGANPTWTQVVLNGAYTFPSTPTIIKAWTSLPNAVIDTMRNNDSVTVTKQPSIQGNFTIDPAGSGATNFTSFTDAVNALSVAGVCGPVTFTVAPGTYTNQVIIGDIAGASAINTITFDGVNPTNRILSVSAASSAVVLMNNSKFITFKNFTVTNTNTANCAGIAMVGSVKNIKIINNRVNVPIQTGTSSLGYGIIATGTAGGIGASAMNGDSILIDSNIVTGGGYSITVYGMSNVNSNKGIVITNNTVLNSNYMGGYIAYNYNPVIVRNNKFNMNGFQYGYYGLYFYYNQSNNTSISHEIIGNTINGFGGYGIYLYYPLQTTTAAKVKCHSNILTSSLGGSYPGLYGIYLYQYNTACNAEIYHNTVSMNGTGTSTTYSCFYNTGSTNTLVKNNIFAVYSGSYTPMYLATNPSGNVVNYNIYYNATNPTSGNLLYRGTFYNPTNFLSATAGGDSSINTSPSFFSRVPLPGNLHLIDGCNGYGVDLRAFVPFDIDGDTFSITPTIGADQFTGGVNDNLRLMSILTPNAPIVAGAQDVSFIVKNIGANAITSYSASYKLNALTPVTLIKTSTVAVCTLDTVLFTGTDQVTLGAVNNLTYYTSLPNTNPDADATNDTLRATLLAPLSGVYTVGGTTPDYATIIDAANALANGVGGPVTFDIRPGTYTGQVVVNGPIPGTSATNTITFEGNDKSTRIVTSSTAGAAFLVNNASFVRVQNLTITNTNASTPVGFAGVSAGSSNTMRGITIKKCNVNVPVLTGTSSTGYGIIFTGTTGGTGVSNCGADSTVIDSNVVTGGGYAITHYGSQNAAFNRGILIRGNTLNNVNYMGIYAYYNYNPMVVNNNTINMQGQNYGYYGIYFYFNQSNNTAVSHELIGNRVNNFGGYGIYCYYPINSATAAKVKIYNNIVIGGTGTSYPGYYGIYLYQASTSFLGEVYHNTVVMNGSVTSTTYSAFYNTGSSLTKIKNNIFVANAPTYTPMYLATSPGVSDVNFNVYYNSSNPTTGSLGYRNGVFFTPATFNTTAAGGDSSFNLNPPFVGAGNYNLTNSCLRGTNLFADVPTDFAGNTRSTSPNIGAYEVATASLDISPTMVLSPSFPIPLGAQDLRVVVRNNGATAVTSFDLTYKLNNGTAVTTTFVGNLATCDTVSVYFTGTQQINLVNQLNNLQLYTSNPNLGADGLPSNDTLLVNLSTPLTGNYVIGAAPSDFLTFNAANDALKIRGANGVVNFMVKTGTYNEQIVLSAYPGSTNPTNQVSFNSIANNADSVTLQFNSVGAPEPNVVKYNGVNGINFNFISIKQLAIATSGTYYTIQFVGVNNFDTINSCKVSMPVYSTTNTAGSYTIYGNGISGNGIALKNSTFTGSYYGVYLYASAAARLDNILIEGNTFSTAYYSPLYYLYYTRYAKFLNNNINITSINGQTTNYMYFYYNDSGYTA